MLWLVSCKFPLNLVTNIIKRKTLIMESNISEPKYHKLATEYAKVRAQASVLKKAVLDEQAKCTNLRDQLRQRETSLRRAEQEVDSLGFRNKQLEHRVAVLQEEIAHSEGRHTSTAGSNKFLSLSFKGPDSKIVTAKAINDGAGDTLIFEELQKKIMENAQLTSLIDDKDRDLQLHVDRISNLEQSLKQRSHDYSDLETRLRRELETFQHRNAYLESKLEGAASLLGSEDALSVSGSDHTTLAAHEISTKNTTSTTSQEERMRCLERELAHCRAQYEILHLTASASKFDNIREINSLSCAEAMQKNGCSCSSSAAGITISANLDEGKHCSEPMPAPQADQIIHNSFSKKFEDLLKSKYEAESHLASYVTETEHLQNCLENATHELKAKEDQTQSINVALQMLEDDLTSTRVNYEEQISILTEQVVSLSEQLAACK